MTHQLARSSAGKVSNMKTQILMMVLLLAAWSVDAAAAAAAAAAGSDTHGAAGEQ
jgi:hypothetical protein